MGRIRQIVLATALCAALVVVPATGGAAAAAPPIAQIAWQPSTPASGTVYTVELGATLTFMLAAAETPAGPTVSIRAQGALPMGMAFVPMDGNPAAATVTWKPTAAQLGAYSVTFVANDDQGTPLIGPAVVYTIRVVPLPGPTTYRLSGVGSISRWASVLRSVTARAAPSSTARAITTLSTITSDGTRNLVLLLDSWVDGSSVWVRVRLPILPNNSTGWVPRSALGTFNEVNTHLYIDRGLMTAVLYKAGKLVFRGRVGVGKPYWPTPTGEFYVRDRLSGFSDPFYGPLAFGTSARSAVLTDWPGGGFVGIHGTSMPGILPGRVSHGCVRLKNSDILRLGRLMPVGTPVTIT
jgi:hypothetical protein